MSSYDKDCSLPALPIPKLEDTCNNLKELIKPLVNEVSAEETFKTIDNFAATKGIKIQQLLIQHAENEFANSSWLRPLWDDMYLSYRGILPINVNYAFKITDGHWGTDGLPVFISALTKCLISLHLGTLAPEWTGKNFLSMDTLASMIYTRIPGNNRDNVYFPPASSVMTASVVCRGHWFILSLTDDDGACLSPKAISDALADIRKQAQAMDYTLMIGTMTCADRDCAVELRGQLQRFPVNRMNLERIEKSQFTVCLDPPLMEGENFNKRLVCGPPENRWYDKSLQIISDGTNMGVNMEHSNADAGIWVYLLNQADALSRADIPHSSKAAKIKQLTWNVPEYTSRKFGTATKQYQDSRKNLSLSSKRIVNVTKERIKALNCSPDAFVQLLYQVAYYKLTGKIPSVYEAAATRRYYQGRTEAVRPVTEQSIAFVLALSEGRGKSLLAELFYKAIEAHSKRLKRAQNALGAERHMAGLSMIAQIYEISVSDILHAEGYNRLRHDTLSTSSVTAPCIDFFSFGPVVEDGIGIGYGIKSEALHISVSSYPESNIAPEEFISEMEDAAKIFYRLLS